jgi:hypothetical protein
MIAVTVLVGMYTGPILTATVLSIGAYYFVVLSNSAANV